MGTFWKKCRVSAAIIRGRISRRLQTAPKTGTRWEGQTGRGVMYGPCTPGTDGSWRLSPPGRAGHLLRGGLPACQLPSARESPWGLLPGLPERWHGEEALGSARPSGPSARCRDRRPARVVWTGGTPSVSVERRCLDQSIHRGETTDTRPNFMLDSQVFYLMFLMKYWCYY